MNDQNLSQIETAWSVIRRAHDGRTESVRSAQEEMLDRYGPAIQRYLKRAARDADAAAEIYQNFSIKFLSGELRSADPERGRFRTFLRTILFRMVADDHRGRKRSPLKQGRSHELTEQATSDKHLEEAFVHSWRVSLLTKSWQRMQQLEVQSGSPHYTVLRMRTDDPNASISDLANRLGQKLERRISIGNFRIMLHRSREQFGDLLLREVAHSLDSTERETLEAELVDLHLLEYCRSALARMS